MGVVPLTPLTDAMPSSSSTSANSRSALAFVWTPPGGLTGNSILILASLPVPHLDKAFVDTVLLGKHFCLRSVRALIL